MHPTSLLPFTDGPGPVFSFNMTHRKQFFNEHTALRRNEGNKNLRQLWETLLREVLKIWNV